MRCPDCESYTAADAERCWKCGRFIAGKPPEPEAEPASRRERKQAKREAKEKEREDRRRTEEAQRRTGDAMREEQERKQAAKAQLEQAAASVPPSNSKRAVAAATTDATTDAPDAQAHLQAVPDHEVGAEHVAVAAESDGGVVAPTRVRRRKSAARRSNGDHGDAAPAPVREGPGLVDIVNVATGAAPASVLTPAAATSTTASPPTASPEATSPPTASPPTASPSNTPLATPTDVADAPGRNGDGAHSDEWEAEPDMAEPVVRDRAEAPEAHDIEPEKLPDAQPQARVPTEEIDWSGRSREKKQRTRRHVVADTDEVQPGSDEDDRESRGAARTRRRKNKRRKRRQLVSNFFAFLVIVGVVAAAGYAVFYYVIS